MANPDVLLVAMPWVGLNRTPIQLGILRPIVEQAGFSVATRCFFLSAMEHFALHTAHLPSDQRITVADYEAIVSRYWDLALGDWIFVVPPYRESTPESDKDYVAYLRSDNVPEEMIEKAFTMRSLAPAFLKQCAEDVLSLSPGVVGFTSSFNQNVASLALSKILKQKDPSIHIVFGGANCDGPMGAALHRAFPWVDSVVRGEAEHVFPELLRNIFAGGPVQPFCMKKKDATFRWRFPPVGMPTTLRLKSRKANRSHP